MIEEMDVNKKIVTALDHAGIDGVQVSFLGEGAWHRAWKITAGESRFVLRIPKEIAYGSAVEYDEAALNAEYGGTELYYRNLNLAVPGSAPEFFIYHVSPELTYTLETYAGEKLDLHTMPESQADAMGRKIGEAYLKSEAISYELNGFGYLDWSKEEGLKGSHSGDPRTSFLEECEEHLEDYQSICREKPDLADSIVNEALVKAIEIRKAGFQGVQLTNQDASPENLVLDNGKVRLIDPYPIAYYGRGMAGNFMCLYETLFILLSETERYAKNRYADCRSLLRKLAEGFLAGYSEGDRTVICEVRAEQLLQLLDMVYQHQQLMAGELTAAQLIRFGSKKDIENRLELLGTELKKYSAAFLELSK